MKKILIGMETSGQLRKRFRDKGFDAWSVDLLPSVDNSEYHIQGDVFKLLRQTDIKWDLGIFHPTCTYLTCSAEWAYKEPNYEKYPGIGYHQKVKQDTLVGNERKAARELAFQDFMDCYCTDKVQKIAVENPIGIVSSWWRKPDQVIQPYMFGDDASKATCLWLKGLPKLVPTNRVSGRIVVDKKTGKLVERWSNQTDSGQNRLAPSDDRWSERSKTYDGIADAMVEQWGKFLLTN